MKIYNLLTIFTALHTASVNAATTSIEVSQDVTIVKTQPTTNFANAIFTSTWNFEDKTNHTLLTFDIRGLNSSNINSVTVEGDLLPSEPIGHAAASIMTIAANSDFDEDTVTFANYLFAPTPTLALANFNLTSRVVTFSSSELTNLVKARIDAGDDFVNFSLSELNTDLANPLAYTSMDNLSGDGMRLILEAVPEPSTSMLFGCGLLAGLLRRKRA